MELICRFSQLIILVTVQSRDTVYEVSLCTLSCLAQQDSQRWWPAAGRSAAGQVVAAHRAAKGKGFQATVNRFFVEFEFMICFPAASFMSFVPKIVRTCVNL